ncbi:hypothetical protein [Paenibacillus xylanilyticus]|uniref:Uncharacterized protein n=1 Tax=Paenibacillus xylanilyticus TaxID=248903 RepID=A0A7Y6BS61_9BACL|nr:hypothetical protein [Paenibacillus xylanilyticus]NUU74037.1 hypothetical protein [Paenibacillus xylanilyticus]
MPTIDNYLLDNYKIDGPANANTRTVILPQRTTDTQQAYTTNMTYTSNGFYIPAINNFLDIYAREPELVINQVGSYLVNAYWAASEQMYFGTSDWQDLLFMLTDNKSQNFYFSTRRNYGTGQSGLTPAIGNYITSLFVDRANRKLYFSSLINSKLISEVDIPPTFNLDGQILFRVGVQKNYTAGGQHTLTVERRSLNVITS